MDADPVERIVRAGIIIAEFFGSPPAFAAFLVEPFEDGVAGRQPESQVGRHSLLEFLGLMGDERVDVAEADPEQSAEDLFGHGHEFFGIDMDRAVAFGFGDRPGSGAVIERRQHDHFRMAGFDPADDLNAGEAVHAQRQMFRMVFNDSERKHHGHVGVDGFTDLIGQHVQVLHCFLLFLKQLDGLPFLKSV